MCAYICVGVTLKDQEFLQTESKSDISWLLDSMKTPQGPGLVHYGRFCFRNLPLGGCLLQVWKYIDTLNIINWPWCWRVQVWHITARLRTMGRGLLTWIWEEVLIENPLWWVCECYDFLGTGSCDTGMEKKWGFSALLPRCLLSRESASPYTSPALFPTLLEILIMVDI